MGNSSWPLLDEDELKRLKQIELVWLVLKFHLAAHIEGCADRFSFNWTTDVGRTCGEIVESNWSKMNGVATATREMGFGQRRDTIIDVMAHFNFTKAINEGMFTISLALYSDRDIVRLATRIATAYKHSHKVYLKKVIFSEIWRVLWIPLCYRSFEMTL